MRIEGEPTPGQIELTNTYLRHRYAYAMWGQVTGFVCVVLGLILVLVGAAGSTSFVVATVGLRVHVNDAVPGVVLVLLGGWVMWVTRYWVDVSLTGAPRDGTRRRK